MVQQEARGVQWLRPMWKTLQKTNERGVRRAAILRSAHSNAQKDNKICPMLIHQVDLKDVSLLAGQSSLRTYCLDRGVKRLAEAVAEADGASGSGGCSSFKRARSSQSLASLGDRSVSDVSEAVLGLAQLSSGKVL